MSAITAISISPRSTRMASSTFPVGYSYLLVPAVVGAGGKGFRNSQSNRPIVLTSPKLAISAPAGAAAEKLNHGEGTETKHSQSPVSCSGLWRGLPLRLL